jgi:hypothetical protein
MKRRQMISDRDYFQGLRALATDPNNQDGADKTWVLAFLRRLERLFKNVRPVSKRRHGRLEWVKEQLQGKRTLTV